MRKASRSPAELFYEESKDAIPHTPAHTVAKLHVTAAVRLNTTNKQTKNLVEHFQSTTE